MLLTFLLTGTAYSEQPPSKPYKVCPEVVKAKDTPCRVQKAEAVVAVRYIEREDPRDKEIAALKERVRQLEEALNVLLQSNR